MKNKYLFVLLALFSLTTILSASSINSKNSYYTIKKNGVLKIGISKNYPPLNFNSGEMGVEIEMAKKLAEFLDVKIKFIPLKVKEYIPFLMQRKVDIIIAGFTRTLKRGKKIWFSTPYISVTPGVLVRKQAIPQTNFGEEFEQTPIRTLWDLKRLNSFSVAIKEGSIYQRLIQEQFPDMPTKFVKSNDEGLDALEKGKVDGFMHDSLYLQYLYTHSAKMRNMFQFLYGGNVRQKICIGLPFGDLILKNQINLFIQEIVETGLISKWLKIYLKK